MNFWTFVLMTNIIAAVAFWATLITLALETVEIWKQRHPGVEIPRAEVRGLEFVQMIGLSLLPVLNTFFLIVFIGFKEQVIEGALDKMWLQVLENRPRDDFQNE